MRIGHFSEYRIPGSPSQRPTSWLLRTSTSEAYLRFFLTFLQPFITDCIISIHKLRLNFVILHIYSVFRGYSLWNYWARPPPGYQHKRALYFRRNRHSENIGPYATSYNFAIGGERVEEIQAVCTYVHFLLSSWRVRAWCQCLLVNVTKWLLKVTWQTTVKLCK